MKSKSSTKKIMEIIHDPLTIPTSKTVTDSTLSLTHIGRICFRGDSRAPNELFKKGFQVRDVMTPQLYERLKAIKSNHLQGSTKQFNAQQFIQDVQDLKELVQSDATAPILKEYEGLTPLYYDAWIEKMLLQIDNGDIEIEADKTDFTAIKEGNIITKPFHTQRVVATAKRFKSALLFPITEELDEDYKKEKSYIYAVYIDKGFDVHMHGIVSSLIHSQINSEPELLRAFQKLNPDWTEQEALQHVRNMLASRKVLNMSLEEVMDAYVEEIVVPSIPCEHIIAAIPVERKVKALAEKYCQGSYQLLDKVEVNERCTLSSEIIRQVQTFLQEERNLNAKAINEKKVMANATLIEPSEGYHEGFSPKISKG